jgi:hypothetical protein
MNTERHIVDYEAKAPALRTRQLSRPVWLLLAGLCGFVEFSGWFSTNGRVNGWGDIAFIIGFAVLGVGALLNGLRRGRTRKEAAPAITAAVVAEAKQNPNGWVYAMDGIADPNGAVPPERIKGAWKVNASGEIEGKFMPNPNYRPLDGAT